MTSIVSTSQDVINRLPQLDAKGSYMKQRLEDEPIEHKHNICEYGKDLPEIRNWK